MRMRLSQLPGLLACLIGFASLAAGQDAEKEKAVKHDLDKLQGEWKLVRCETDGSKLDIEAAKIVIKQNSYVMHIGPGAAKGTFTLDPLANLKQWDSRFENSKKTTQSLYDLNGNRLLFAYRKDNKRPASLFGKRGSGEGHILFVFERGDGKPERADDRPKKDVPTITVAADKVPFRSEVMLAQSDSRVVILPSGKRVTLWVGKDRFGLGKTKSGLYCEWEKEDYIKQGAVIYASKSVEHELFVGDWKLSYVNDLESSPKLKVTILVTQRKKK